MADKRLVVTDVDPQSPEFGAMLAVAPGSATALPIPAFRMGAAQPPTGVVAGEGFINTNSGAASVWDGNQWNPIVQGALLSYPTDADVIADAHAPASSYAASMATGNLFVKGATAWRQIGVRTYATATALLADNAPEGSLGVAEDEETFWVVHGGVWHCHSRRPVADVQALAAWLNPPEGSTAMEQAHELRYHYHTGQWRPESIWVQTEATILATQDRIDGQMAVAQDTGHIYVWHSGRWMSSQIQHYQTEQALLNDTPNDGILAWGDDNGLVYARFGGNWRRLNSPTVTIAATAPVNPANGDIFYDTVANTTTIYDGTAWQPVAATARAPTVEPPTPVEGDLWLDTTGSTPELKVCAGAAWNPVSGTPVGTIIMYPNITPPPGYLLCNGANIDVNLYPQLHAMFSAAGGKLPDLGDQFVRGASSNADVTGSVKHQDTTRRPRSNLTGITNDAGRHRHFANRDGGSADASWLGGNAYLLSDQYTGGSHVGGTNTLYTNYENDHHHTVTVNGGGDAETAPKHVKLAFHIKHDVGVPIPALQPRDPSLTVTATGGATATIDVSLGGRPSSAGTITVAGLAVGGVAIVGINPIPVSAGATGHQVAVAIANELSSKQDTGQTVTITASPVGSQVTITETGGGVIDAGLTATFM